MAIRLPNKLSSCCEGLPGQKQGRGKQHHWLTATALFCGMVVIPYYWMYMNVAISVDGKLYQVKTFERNVGKILEVRRIAYGPLDIIQPDIFRKVKSGETISIIRVAEKTFASSEEIPYTITQRTETADNLRPVEIQEGYTGKRFRTVKVVYHDGAEHERHLLEEKMEKMPSRKLLLKNKKGKVIREYDLRKAKSIWVTATSYYPYDPLCYPGGDGIHTCLGLKLRRGFVAVDPKVIPLRTRLYIPGYGYGYAADTGSAIKGRRIDVALNTERESHLFGKRAMKVYILGSAASW